MRSHASFLARISNSAFLRYAAAVLAVLTSSAICNWLHAFAGTGSVYVLLLLAVVLSGWYCGIGPSIVATSLAVCAAMLGFHVGLDDIRALTFQDKIDLLVFLFSSILVIVMAETRRRQNESLRQSQGEMEAKVRERTADLARVNLNLRELSARLLQLQDEERRRIARELHDSVGQMLAALSMNLSTVRSDVERLTRTTASLIDSESLVKDMVSEVRTISYLLHPPLLDELGLPSALRWYVDGFSQRSGIQVDLDLPEDFGRLPADQETAIFRVVQECLTNIHRHSGSPIARIRVRQRDEEISVEIADKGKGIPPEKLQEMATTGTPGVGIRGMQERLRQLGGTAEIQSSEKGTLVSVRLPVDQASESMNPSQAAA
jgi:signal transduction histidine kinase